MTAAGGRRAPAWAALERALAERRPVRVRYHGNDRVVCPHALGWKNGRAKVLAYQAAGTTSRGPLPHDPRQRWRSLFVDQIEGTSVTDGPWETAPNYAPTHSNCIDTLDVAIPTSASR